MNAWTSAVFLTAVAGGSSVAAVGAVAVKAAPGLRAYAAMFAQIGRAPETDTKTQ